jgi:hypothetical protein
VFSLDPNEPDLLLHGFSRKNLNCDDPMSTTIRRFEARMRRNRRAFGPPPYDSDTRMAMMVADTYGHLMRRHLVWRYSFAVPTLMAFTAIRGLGRDVVEMGAGTGYWAWLLRKRDVNVVAYDRDPCGPESTNKWFGKPDRDASPEVWEQWHASKWRMPKPWIDDVIADKPTALRAHRDRALMLCWPPMRGKGEDMASESLGYWRGDSLIYIGEGEGGCTATGDFWRLLERMGFRLAARIGLPQFWGINDWMGIYTRGRGES